MPEKEAPWNVSRMAGILRWRRNQGRDTVLVVGSRAGGLFRSEEFYETLKLFGDPSFSSLPRIKKFGQCYRILTQPQYELGPGDVERILTDALKEIDIIDADICLAELVKSGFFGIIVTTSMDNLLEESLKSLGMKEMYDFEVFRLHDDVEKDKLHVQNNMPCKVFKVFGELTTQEYVVRRAGYINRNPHIKEMLEGFLEQDVMVIGLDPVWDEEIYQAFRLQGNSSFWFINEEEPEEYTLLSQIGDARSVNHFIELSANYEQFVHLLYYAVYFIGATANQEQFMHFLYYTITKQTQSGNQALEVSSIQQRGERSLDQSHPIDGSPTTAELTATSLTPHVARRTLEIFISYAARDEPLMSDLLEHLASLKHEKIIREWHNRKIQPGQVYANEIDSHLNSADIILLLISASFINSSYIYSGELTQAMKLHNEGKAHVIPVILRAVDWKGMPFGGLKPLPTDGKPVKSWKDRDRAWLDIIQGIREAAKEHWKIT